jgi:hypothetical protein
MRDQVLTSLAILNTNWTERRQSYIDNFIPFVAEALIDTEQEEISASEVQEIIVAKFGLRIPQHALLKVLKRAARIGIVKKESGVFLKEAEPLQKLVSPDRRRDALRECEALISRFVGFCSEVHSVTLERDAASEILLSYIETRSLPVLSLMTRQDGAPEDESVVTLPEEFMLADFIRVLAREDPEGFRFLETVVKGSMLATALYLPNPGSMGSPVRDLTVYLDTPLILRALGYHGPSEEAAARELVDLLKQLGARLRCFSFTLTETRGVLNGCAGALRNPRRKGESVSSIAEYALRAGLSSADLDLRAERLEESLHALGVRIDDPPPYTVELTVDEAELEQVLQEAVDYWHDEARVHDVNCLTSIYRIRRGQQQRDFESSKAIFVTTNSSLIAGSHAFFGEKADGYTVPICARDHEIATIAWLKRPLGAPDLPRKQIIADCYATLYPGDALWRKYLDSIERYKAEGKVTEEDYVVLRFSLEARRALMDHTLGDSEAFVLGAVPEILAKAREAMSETARMELDQKSRDIEAERQARQTAELADVVLRGEDRERELARRHEERLDLVSQRLADVAGSCAFWGVAVVMLVGVGVTLPSPLPGPHAVHGLLAVLVGVFAAAVVVAMLLSVMLGWTAKSLSTRVAARLRPPIRSLLGRVFSP